MKYTWIISTVEDIIHGFILLALINILSMDKSMDISSDFLGTHNENIHGYYPWIGG
jgi:hypothetical protein